MSWFRVDDGSAFHSKVVAAGNEAWGAFCRAGAHCAREGSDGFFSESVAKLIGSSKIWRRLLDAKLIEKCQSGYQIHDYLQWNPSSAEVTQKRQELSEKRRIAGIRGNDLRWAEHRKQGRKTVASCEEQNIANESPHPIPSHPREEEREAACAATLSEKIQEPPMPSKPKASKQDRKHPIPANWTPKASHYERAAEKHFSKSWVDSKAEDMRLWAESKGEKKVGWDATFLGWIKRDMAVEEPDAVPRLRFELDPEPDTGPGVPMPQSFIEAISRFGEAVSARAK